MLVLLFPGKWLLKVCKVFPGIVTAGRYDKLKHTIEGTPKFVRNSD